MLGIDKEVKKCYLTTYICRVFTKLRITWAIFYKAWIKMLIIPLKSRVLTNQHRLNVGSTSVFIGKDGYETK